VSWIPVRLRRQVVERAQQRCEYCQLSQQGQAASFTSITPRRSLPEDRRRWTTWPLLRVLFVAQGGPPARPRSAKRRVRPSVPSPPDCLGRPLSLGRRAHSRAHGEGSRHRRGTKDESPADGRHSARRSCAGTAPSRLSVHR
jgi:hypothetical protein